MKTKINHRTWKGLAAIAALLALSVVTATAADPKRPSTNSSARPVSLNRVLPWDLAIAGPASGPAPSAVDAAFTFDNTGSLNTARLEHTAALLPNGKVLVAGGIGSGNFSLTSAELYDPASGSWTATGSLNTARYYHTATLLPNGKVLVAGGDTSSLNPSASAELYDPASGSWTATGSLNTARHLHSATLLPNGKVLVAGGNGNSG